MNERDVIKAIIKEYQQREMHLISRDVKLPRTNKAIAIIGIRRSGKTSLLFDLFKKTEKINNASSSTFTISY